MKLPDVREELHKLASDLDAAGLGLVGQRLAYLAEQTRRRSPLKRAEPRAKPITDETKKRIRDTAAAHPAWSLREIGRHVGVDQGRVSEVLRGFRQ